MIHPTWTVRFCLLSAAVLFLFCGSLATAEDANWQKDAESQLQDVYLNGRMSPRRFQPEWLPDSSGYIVQEKEKGSNKTVRARYDVQTGKRTIADAPERNRGNTSPDGKHVVEFRDRNLFVRELESGQHTRLTNRPDGKDIWYRKPIWSPDGKRIAFIESDESRVRQRPVLVPVDPSYPKVANNRFARVGEKINSLRIGVVDAEGKELEWLAIDTPSEGFYLGQVEWAGNSDELLVEKLSRFRDRREFLIANIGSGKIKKIYEETNEAWAVGSQEKNLNLIWLRDGEAFIVISEKDGWRHAFLYSRDGKDELLLTPGEYDVIDRGVVDEAEQCFYFYASPENGTQLFLYRVPLDGSGKLERITPEDQAGTNRYLFSPDVKWAIHTHSGMDSPPVFTLVNLPEHQAIRTVEDNSELRARVDKLITHPTEFFQIDIGDGVTMDAWMMKPKDFDENKKYPLFIYVYGEPYAQTVLDHWGAGQSHFHRVVADQGYLVVSIDNRGTPAPKGAAWRRSIFRSLGPLSTEDQAAALKEMGRMKPYVDLSRVAIWGWSGGGSNTLNAMFRKPDQYHVGIAVVPKPQPHLYNAWFQEIYMRDRKVNPDGYQKSAPLNFAEGLQGKLLIVTGSGETNTHIQIIEGLVDRLIELGKPFDYMVYPNRDHGLAEGRGTKVHVRMLILRYLIEHLPRGPR